MDAPLRERWPKLSGVGLLEQTREIKGKGSCERAYFMGSKGIACAEAFATAAAVIGGSKTPCAGRLMSPSARTVAGFARDMPRRTSSPSRKFALALLRRDETSSVRQD
jgi:hypothetical protein